MATTAPSLGEWPGESPEESLGESLGGAGNPCLFIVGCLRSGTTMLRHIVDAHPELAVVNETQWLPGWFEHRRWRPGLTEDALVLADALPELFALERFDRLDVDPVAIREWMHDAGPFAYVDFVRGVFDAHGRTHGKALVGEKSPGYVRHLPTLCSLWPKARIVHLVRDGRDVLLSVAAWKPEKQARTIGRFSTWARDPVVTAALWWEWHVRLGLEAGGHLGPDRYHQLRYEDLVADPELECRRLCRFLGLAYDEAMLRFHERHGSEGTPSPRRGPALPITPGLRDWRMELDPGSVRRFETAVRPLLDQLGYVLGADRLSEADVAGVDAIRRVFDAEARAQRHRVPGWPPGGMGR